MAAENPVGPAQRHWPGCNRDASVLVQGTEFLKDRDAGWTAEFLDQVFLNGSNVFDLAHDYGKGRCETLLGDWLQSRRVPREHVVLITKAAHPWNGNPRVHPDAIRDDLAESLDRLQTDSVDILLLHRDDPSVPVGPLMTALHAAIEAGHCRAIGVSNWTWARTVEAQTYAETEGLTRLGYISPHIGPIEPVQPPWPGCTSIAGPTHRADRAAAARAGIIVLGWAALCLGYLTGDSEASAFDAMSEHCLTTFDSPDNRIIRSQLCRTAHDTGCTLPQAAIAWLLAQPLDIRPVVAAQTTAQVQSNVAATRLSLASGAANVTPPSPHASG